MGASDTIERLRSEGKLFRILTNDASRSQHRQREAFYLIGLSSITEYEIITLSSQILTKSIPYPATKLVLQRGVLPSWWKLP